MMLRRVLLLMGFLASTAVWGGDPSKVVALLAINGARVSGGTGFVVEAQSGLYYTITNAHVCADSKNGMMTSFSQYQDKRYNIHILRMGTTVDLCVLEYTPCVPPTRYGHNPHPLQGVTIMGHPGLGPLVTSSGYVEATINWQFETTAPVAPGSSGSPVLNGNGYIVGIVFAYDPNTKVSYGINVETIKAFLTGL